MLFLADLLKFKTTFGKLWLAGTLGVKRRPFSKDLILNSDIEEFVAALFNVEIPLSPRLSGTFLCGLCAIYEQKCHFLQLEVLSLFRRLYSDHNDNQLVLRKTLRKSTRRLRGLPEQKKPFSEAPTLLDTALDTESPSLHEVLAEFEHNAPDLRFTQLEREQKERDDALLSLVEKQYLQSSRNRRTTLDDYFPTSSNGAPVSDDGTKKIAIDAVYDDDCFLPEDAYFDNTNGNATVLDLSVCTTPKPQLPTSFNEPHDDVERLATSRLGTRTQKRLRPLPTTALVEVVSAQRNNASVERSRLGRSDSGVHSDSKRLAQPLLQSKRRMKRSLIKSYYDEDTTIADAALLVWRTQSKPLLRSSSDTQVSIESCRCSVELPLLTTAALQTMKLKFRLTHLTSLTRSARLMMSVSSNMDRENCKTASDRLQQDALPSLATEPCVQEGNGTVPFSQFKTIEKLRGLFDDAHADYGNPLAQQLTNDLGEPLMHAAHVTPWRHVVPSEYSEQSITSPPGALQDETSGSRELSSLNFGLRSCEPLTSGGSIALSQDAAQTLQSVRTSAASLFHRGLRSIQDTADLDFYDSGRQLGMDTASSFLLNRQNTRNSAATTDLCSTMERADCLFLPTSNAHAMNFLSLSIETESQSCIGRKRRVSAGSGCGRSFSTSANCGDVSPHYALHYYTAETYRLRELLQQQLLNVEASIYSFTDLVVPGQVHSLIAARTFYHILLLATYGEIQVQQPTTADPILLSMVPMSTTETLQKTPAPVRDGQKSPLLSERCAAQRILPDGTQSSVSRTPQHESLVLSS